MKLEKSYVEQKSLIDALDLEPIKFRLVTIKSWSLEEADATELLYKRFLLLCKLYPKKSFVPINQIDVFWHEHILDTAKYSADCEHIFGYFLHHFPYLGLRGEEDVKNSELAFAETKEIYRSVFGDELSYPLAA